jgi:hypothetical protein
MRRRNLLAVRAPQHIQRFPQLVRKHLAPEALGDMPFHFRVAPFARTDRDAFFPLTATHVRLRK